MQSINHFKSIVFEEILFKYYLYYKINEYVVMISF